MMPVPFQYDPSNLSVSHQYHQPPTSMVCATRMLCYTCFLLTTLCFKQPLLMYKNCHQSPLCSIACKSTIIHLVIFVQGHITMGVFGFPNCDLSSAAKTSGKSANHRARGSCCSRKGPTAHYSWPMSAQHSRQRQVLSHAVQSAQHAAQQATRGWVHPDSDAENMLVLVKTGTLGVRRSALDSYR